METQSCPLCGDDCDRDSVDVGVGFIHGPWGCPSCGWSEDPRYDCSKGPAPESAAYPEHYVDQWGGRTSLPRLKDKMEHFGLDPQIIDEVFGD